MFSCTFHGCSPELLNDKALLFISITPKSRTPLPADSVRRLNVYKLLIHQRFVLRSVVYDVPQSSELVFPTSAIHLQKFSYSGDQIFPPSLQGNLESLSLIHI